MSRSAAFFWILVAALLGTVVWATTPRERASAAESPLLPDFSISGCERLAIAWPDGQSATLERGPLDGMWLLKTPGGEQTVIAWPIESGRMQGLLRLLSELRASASTTPAAAMPKAVVISIERKGAPALHLAVDPNTLGGTGRVALVDDSSRVKAVAPVTESFVRTLDRSAIESWRLTDLLPWPPESSMSIRTTSSAGEADLARAGSGWIMQAPITTRADAGAVQGVLLLLSKTAFERFLPVSAGSESGFSPPARRIVIGARPTNAQNSTRIEQRIEVGPALDAQSRIVRVAAVEEGKTQPLWGPVYGVVDSSTLAAISEDPASYISRIGVDLVPADIAKVEFGTGHAPIERDGNGSFGAADSTVREFLRLLCETPAASTLLAPSTVQTESPDLIAVRLLGPKGELLKQLQVRATTMNSKIAGSPSTGALEITDGRIVRLVPAQRPRDILAALSDASSKR